MTLDLSELRRCVVPAAISVWVLLTQQIIAEPRVGTHPTYPGRNPFIPTFLPTPSNVTANKGEDAILQCAVENRGTRTIVWRKASDRNPITIAEKTFIGDTRFKVVNQKHSLEWNLKIMNVQPKDAGEYECQVSAKKRDVRQIVRLIVEEKTSYKSSKPEIHIHGSFFVERGDTLKLVCNATGNEYAPDDIDWFKDGNKIKNAGRISLIKDVFLSERTIISSLMIRRGHMGDAGTYVCRTSDLQIAAVKVNVLNTGTNNEKRESADATHMGSKPDNSQQKIHACRNLCFILATLVTVLHLFSHKVS